MLLEIKNLSVEFRGIRGTVQALKGISLSIAEGEILGIVGESGSGKSVTALSILGLLGKHAVITGGEVLYKGRNLLALDKKAWTAIRGKEIGMVFQEPMTALHPTMKVGRQLAEVIRRHRGVSRKEARRLAVAALEAQRTSPPERLRRLLLWLLKHGFARRVVPRRKGRR